MTALICRRGFAAAAKRLESNSSLWRLIGLSKAKRHGRWIGAKKKAGYRG